MDKALALAAAALVAQVSLGPRVALVESQPDIAVIVADDFSKFDLGDIPTPQLDSLRAASTWFGRANTACSMCSPSRASITGQYGRRFNLGRIIQKGEVFDIPAGTTTVASKLRDAGYLTAHVGKWHLSGGVNYPLNDAPGLLGFDYWRAMATHNPAATLQPGPGGSYDEWGRVDDGVYSVETTYMTTAQTDAAVAWWEENEGCGAPRFLWVSYNTPHAPFHVPPASAMPPGFGFPTDPDGRAMYELMVQSMDHEIGRLLGALDGALVMFWADNGTPIADAAQDPDKIKQSMYEQGIGTPFFVRPASGRPFGGKRRLVSMVDLFGTLCDVAGAPWIPGDVDSLSFADAIGYTSSTSVRTWSFAERYNPNGTGVPNRRERMVRSSDNYKLIVEEQSGIESFRGLFDLTADPSESFPVNDPAKEAELQAILDGI